MGENETVLPVCSAPPNTTSSVGSFPHSDWNWCPFFVLSSITCWQSMIMLMYATNTSLPLVVLKDARQHNWSALWALFRTVEGTESAHLFDKNICKTVPCLGQHAWGFMGWGVLTWSKDMQWGRIAQEGLFHLINAILIRTWILFWSNLLGGQQTVRYHDLAIRASAIGGWLIKPNFFLYRELVPWWASGCTTTLAFSVASVQDTRGWTNQQNHHLLIQIRPKATAHTSWCNSPEMPFCHTVGQALHANRHWKT